MQQFSNTSAQERLCSSLKATLVLILSSPGQFVTPVLFRRRGVGAFMSRVETNMETWTRYKIFLIISGKLLLTDGSAVGHCLSSQNSSAQTFLRSLLNNAERVLLCTREKIWPLFKDFPCFPSNSELNLHFASAKIFGAHSHENHWEKKTS